MKSLDGEEQEGYIASNSDNNIDSRNSKIEKKKMLKQELDLKMDQIGSPKLSSS